MVRNNPAYSLGLYEKAIPAGLGFREMLECTRRNGFDRLEISIDESDARLSRLDWSDGQKNELAQLTREMGVPIQTMCLSGHRKYPFGSHDPQKRERSLDIMKKAVDFSAQIGVGIIQLAGYDVYYETSTEQSRAYFLENLQKAVSFAASAGVILAFETMEIPFMDTVAKAMHYVDQIHSPWLGAYPDIGNLQNAAVLYGTDVVEDLQTGAGHIFAMHLKETVPGVFRNMAFGTGHTRYDPCLDFAAAQGIRMFTGEFWHLDGEDHEAVISRSNRFLRERLDAAFSRISV